MRAVRIYKDNIREHVLRSLFFSDTVIFAGIGGILAIILFALFQFLFHHIIWGPYILSVIGTEVFLVIVATIQVDNQTLLSLAPRAITYRAAKRHYTTTALDTTISDFTIVDQYIRRKNQLLAVFEIEPFDIALLNDDEQERFYNQLKTMLHTLPAQVQFIVRKQRATSKDYQKHFFSLYKDSDAKRETLLRSYIADMESLLSANNLQIIKYYAVLSTPLASEAEEQFATAIKKIFDQSIRLSTSLSSANIHLQQLSREELVTYCKTQLL